MAGGGVSFCDRLRSRSRDYQGESKPFEFTHLPVGDYVLVFNRRDQADPDGPFPRTFYPNAPDRSSAQIIHLEDGQQIMNADIHLRRVSMPTRKVTIHLLWDGGKPQDYYASDVIVEASEGVRLYPNIIRSRTAPIRSACC
jgi:hypothetical protein